MLAIESAEIGGTLIALSVPGLKPLFQRRFSNLGFSLSKTKSTGPSVSIGSNLQGSRAALKLERTDTYERAPSEVSVPVGLSTRDSDEKFLESGLMQGPRQRTVSGISITTMIASDNIPLQQIPCPKI